jgi:hypothetical protein
MVFIYQELQNDDVDDTQWTEIKEDDAVTISGKGQMVYWKGVTSVRVYTHGSEGGFHLKGKGRLEEGFEIIIHGGQYFEEAS